MQTTTLETAHWCTCPEILLQLLAVSAAVPLLLRAKSYLIAWAFQVVVDEKAVRSALTAPEGAP
jgi:hypothetical protein